MRTTSDKVVNITARGPGRKLRIAVGAVGSTQGHGSKRVRNRMMTWTELTDKLAGTIRTRETVVEYHRMGKTEQLSTKDQGYFLGGHCAEGVRKKGNMVQRDVLAIDGDFATPDWRDKLYDALLGYAWCAHTTHKHTDTKPRYRLLMPLAKPVSEFEYALLCRYVASSVHMDTFDPAGHRWVQAMFWPSTPADGEYVHLAEDGTWLDVDTVKEEFADWRDVQQWPGADRESEALRHSMQAAPDPREKKGLVGAFCRTYDIYQAMEEFIPDAYQQTDTSDRRFSYSDGTSRNGAVVYDNGLFLYSHHGSDPCGGLLVNAFDMVRLHRFANLDMGAKPDMAMTKLPSFLAMEDLANSDEKVRVARIGERINDDPMDEFDAVERAEDAAAEEQPTDTAWHGTLALDDNGEIKRTLNNAAKILTNDERTKGKIYYDAFAGGIQADGKIPHYTSTWSVWPAQWQDEMDLALRYYIDQRYQVDFSGPMIADAVAKTANSQPKHAVLDWLKTLQWDGVERVERLWIDYLGTPDTLYYRETAKAFLVGAVRRVLQPGCKFDYVPILEGVQGKRKSTFWRVLANGHFTELHTFDDKKAAEILAGIWIAEVPELEPFNKSDVEVIKAFFTSQAPKFRGAWRRHAAAMPRQCVFAGTTNRRTGYLKDPTGNRRFWPIGYVDHDIDTDRLQRELGQIWAEAFVMHDCGEQPYLSKEGEALAQVEQRKREQVDEWTGKFEAWLDKPASSSRYSDTEAEEFDTAAQRTERINETCIPELWVDCLGRNLDSIRQGDRSRIKAAVEATGTWRCTERQRRFGSRFGKQRLIVRIGD